MDVAELGGNEPGEMVSRSYLAAARVSHSLVAAPGHPRPNARGSPAAGHSLVPPPRGHLDGAPCAALRAGWSNAVGAISLQRLVDGGGRIVAGALAALSLRHDGRVSGTRAVGGGAYRARRAVDDSSSGARDGRQLRGHRRPGGTRGGAQEGAGSSGRKRAAGNSSAARGEAGTSGRASGVERGQRW